MNNSELNQIILDLCEGRIGTDRLPFNEIITFVSENYDKFCSTNNQLFEKEYGKLLLFALENHSEAIITDILLLLSKNVEIISSLCDELNKRQSYNEYITNLYSESLMKAKFYRNRYQKCKSEEHKKDFFIGKKCAVYSVITGEYDNVRDPLYIEPNTDYFLFTNNKELSSNIWKVIYINNSSGLNNIYLQRKIKILGHELLEEYDYTIYLDGNLQVQKDLNSFIAQYNNGESMICFPHPSRSTLEEEANAIINTGKVDASTIKKQLYDYKNDGYNNNVELIESGCLIRSNHDPKVKAVMNDWWLEINKYSHRDQMSFSYVCWKNNYTFDLCDLNVRENDWLHYYEHNILK